MQWIVFSSAFQNLSNYDEHACPADEDILSVYVSSSERAQ